MAQVMSAQLLENRYRILKALGQGGFGETFLAEDLHMPSSRRCVIKQLKPVTNDPAIYQIVKDRFQREAVILERLGERNRQIPTLFAYFTASGQFYLVQEWIEGETLAEAIASSGVWSSAAVAQLLLGILPVLDFIHDQGIVHRDIKPDNIILRQGDRQPVLIDFGAVKETMGTVMNTAGQTTSSIVIGTPGFMSSEQAIGRPVFSSDLYSLALTGIYLLTGKFPHEFPADPATGKLLWQDDIPNLDPHLATVLNQAICTHPRDRFTNANAMVHALQNPDNKAIPVAVPPTAVPPISHQPQPISTSTPPTAVPGGASATNLATLTENVSAYPQATKKSMPSWQKALLSGSVVAAFLVGGVMLSNQFKGEQNPEPTQPNPVPTTVTPKPIPEPEPVVVDETSGYGRYTDLIQVINCETALEEYGRYNDWGYWEGGSTVCEANAQPGYWVYVYPDWYVWATETDSTDPSVNRPSPTAFMESYYSIINSRNIAQAWRMLTPTFQGYSESYAEFYEWWNSVDEVKVLDVSLVSQAGNSAVVEVRIDYVIDGEIYGEEPLRYDLMWNEQLVSWQINDRA
ncbi:serine/threonine protein kinase [[Limnothrix rosea] IAM M-220]|nr:serine/threonine protein kinase [[Limnothrix rosea] IAM M-220]